MKFLLPLSTLLFAGQTLSATVKVMPFGASIAGKCWRANLDKKLKDNNITNKDFVGSIKGEDCGFPYDSEHEGHGGSLATDWAKNNQLVGYLSSAKPDVVMMHLGTNDLLNNKTNKDIIAAYDVLIGQMRDSKSSMRILVSTLIPLDPARWPKLAAGNVSILNDMIKEWVPKKTTKTSPITLVDNFAGFNATTDTVEGEHPNEKGNQKIADKFYQPLVDAIKSVSAA